MVSINSKEFRRIIHCFESRKLAEESYQEGNIKEYELFTKDSIRYFHMIPESIQNLMLPVREYRIPWDCLEAAEDYIYKSMVESEKIQSMA